MPKIGCAHFLQGMVAPGKKVLFEQKVHVRRCFLSRGCSVNSGFKTEVLTYKGRVVSRQRCSYIKGGWFQDRGAHI